METLRNTIRELKYRELHPRSEWQDFTKSSLPTDLKITDIDGIARRTATDGVEEVIMYELKSLGSRLRDRPAQSISIQIINAALKEISGKLLPIRILTNKINKEVRYLGFYEIVFLGQELEWSKGVLLNGQPSSQMEIINLLSFTKEIEA